MLVPSFIRKNRVKQSLYSLSTSTVKQFGHLVLFTYCHLCCAEHDASEDGEEINEKSSTPVKRNASLRARRHHVAKREPTKDANKASDDVVFFT